MIRIITDSTADIGLAQAKELDISIVPLKVIIDKKTYNDRVDLQPEQFYQLLQETDTLPTTSQPSPQEFLTFYEEAKAKGDSVVVMTLSSHISGTYQSAMIAKDLSEYDNIYVIDSLNATQGLRLLVEKAIQLRNDGKTASEMFDILDIYKHRICIFALVDTLEYFYKGGRLSKASAIAGTMLKLKPIVGLKEGNLELISKARGTQKATLKIIDIVKETGEIDLNEPVCIGYTGDNVGIDKFENTLREALGFNDVLYGFVGPVIGTHAGPGGRVIAFVKK
ncbi:MAG: DegV family protein [Coprobacillus sp.]